MMAEAPMTDDWHRHFYYSHRQKSQNKNQLPPRPLSKATNSINGGGIYSFGSTPDYSYVDEDPVSPENELPHYERKNMGKRRPRSVQHKKPQILSLFSALSSHDDDFWKKRVESEEDRDIFPFRRISDDEDTPSLEPETEDQGTDFSHDSPPLPKSFPFPASLSDHQVGFETNTHFLKSNANSRKPKASNGHSKQVRRRATMSAFPVDDASAWPSEKASADTYDSRSSSFPSLSAAFVSSLSTRRRSRELNNYLGSEEEEETSAKDEEVRRNSETRTFEITIASEQASKGVQRERETSRRRGSSRTASLSAENLLEALSLSSSGGERRNRSRSGSRRERSTTSIKETETRAIYREYMVDGESREKVCVLQENSFLASAEEEQTRFHDCGNRSITGAGRQPHDYYQHLNLGSSLDDAGRDPSSVLSSSLTAVTAVPPQSLSSKNIQPPLLPGLDRKKSLLVIEIVEGRNLESSWYAPSKFPDAYAVLQLGPIVRQTSPVACNINPFWGETFQFDLSLPPFASHNPAIGEGQDAGVLALKIFSESAIVFDMFESANGDEGEFEDNQALQRRRESFKRRRSSMKVKQAEDSPYTNAEDYGWEMVSYSQQISANEGAANTTLYPDSGPDAVTSYNRRSDGLIAVDEPLGFLHIPLSSICNSSRPLNDGWYSVQGYPTGEIHVRSFFIEDTQFPPHGCSSGSELIEKLLKAGAETQVESLYGGSINGQGERASQHFDQYGFPVPAYGMLEWKHIQLYSQCREMRQVEAWEAYFQSGEGVPISRCTAARQLSTGEPTAAMAVAKEKIDNLRPLVWQGVPRHLREMVYMKISGALQKRLDATEKMRADVAAGRTVVPHSTTEYYPWMIARAEEELDDNVKRQIDLDINRTFGNAKTRAKTAEGREKLRKVLRAYAMRNEAVRYCQGMNFVAGFLLVSFEEESVFWLLSVICEDLHPGYYTSTMTDTQTDMRVLKDLLSLKLPELDEHADVTGLPLELVATQWLLCLFTTTFPAETVYRVLDCLFLEGSKMMFAVILAHLRHQTSSLLRRHDLQGVISQLKRSEATMFDADKLLSSAYEEMRELSDSMIETRRQQHRKIVERQMQLLNKRRQQRGEGGTGDIGRSLVSSYRFVVDDVSRLRMTTDIVPAIQRMLVDTVQMSALILPDWLVFKYALQAASWLVGTEESQDMEVDEVDVVMGPNEIASLS